MRNNRYVAIFNGVCWSLLVKKSTSIFQDFRSRDYGYENDQTDRSLSVSGRGSIAAESLYSGGSVGWTKEMIMEEAKRYLRGEKEFSEFQDLSLDTEESSEKLPTGPGEAGVVGPSSAESLNKVVTALNDTFYLYIPKVLNHSRQVNVNVFAPGYGH